MTENSKPATAGGRLTTGAMAGAAVTGLAAFVLSMFGFSDRLSRLSTEMDALRREFGRKEAQIERMADAVWEMRRELRAMRKPPPKDDK